MVYTFTAQQLDGTRLTGLTPTFLHFKDVTALAAQSDLTAPTIYEIAHGDYGFSYDCGWKVVTFCIDLGATAAPRYITGTYDSRVESVTVNKLVVNGSTSKLEIYDETGTKIAEAALTDAAGAAINITGTTQPCNRGTPA